MRIINILFAFLLFSACSVHTVTNKTNLDFEIKKSGGDQLALRANSCIELSEYFIGLGGDFPFAIRIIDGGKSYSEEHSAGNYEITSTADTENPSPATGEQSFSVSLSSKNLSCEGEKEEEEEGNINEKMVAVCNEQPAECAQSGKAKCNSENAPVCVDTENKILKDTSPSCKDSSVEVTCKEKSDEKPLQQDTQTRVFCLSGQAQCSGGAVVSCIKENDQSVPVPACLMGTEKVADVVCVDSSTEVPIEGGTPKCLQPTTVTLPEGVVKPVLCGNLSIQVQCSNNEGTPVCGQIPGDTSDQPYCVNQDNIRWSSSVVCSNSSTPTCP